MKILIGSAWPYANGSLHIGHLAALLPADLLARYHRAKGDTVYFVSGSDCHGTPVAIRAKQENKTAEEISDWYHEEFCRCFERLGFSYDFYGKTASEAHKAFVQSFHEKLYESKYIYEKSGLGVYCEGCNTFLADRFVLGNCPSCGEKARGDQCDACGSPLEPENLLEAKCQACGRSTVLRETKHLYIALTELIHQLQAYVEAHPDWRKNAIAFSKRYMDEGLRDRALTRDLDWGIAVPKDGYENKKIYIWAENVLGYLSASLEACRKQSQSPEEDFAALWGKEAKHYYVHGKDNIPFHTIILPSLLLAHGAAWHLPDEIVSSEHLTLDGKKISTSQNHAIWVKDLLDYNPDSIRYFLIANGPERRDGDFSWPAFKNSNNGELMGAYGNFVNRNLSFIARYFGGRVPTGKVNAEIKTRLDELFSSVGTGIEQGAFKDALKELFEFVRFMNKYFDTEKPWETRNTDSKACEDTLFNCVYVIANLAVLLCPFLPFSSEKVAAWLNEGQTRCTLLKWEQQPLEGGFLIPEPEKLFERME